MDSGFLIYEKRAGAGHIRIALGFAAILALTCLAVFPWRMVRLPKIFIFIPVIDTVHLLFCAITAAVLFALASVLRSRALVALGAGYVFVGFMAVVHALTFPNAISPMGLLGATPDTGTWLYLAWHTVLPMAIIVYALLSNPAWGLDRPLEAPRRAILLCLALTLMAAAGWSWTATRGMPPDFGVTGELAFADCWHYLVILLSGVPILLLWRGRRSILDLCLMLTLWAWFLEYVDIFPGAARFSVGWYAGRVMGLVSGLFVLLMLLIEMSRLYARTVMLIAAQSRDRQSRLMLGEAVGAFIAHELRQPLAAISLNAYTAQKLGFRNPGIQSAGELSGVLDDLMADSRRANDIIESTRALFAESAADKRPTDINQLVQDTLLMASHELRSHKVRVAVALEERLPLVAVNRMQMQQVLMNLFINAAEAMSVVTEHPRALTIRSSSSDIGLIIRVEDTGPSIVPDVEDRIFDPFFTTKAHGTGMGLSICRSVVQAHGGSIQMAARTPFGASFEIVLPHDSAAVPAA